MHKHTLHLALLILLFPLTGCVSGYKQFYTPAKAITSEQITARRISPPPVIPLVERTAIRDPKEITDIYNKRGYVVIGHSSFNSGTNESDEAAIAQGKEVGADLVLIFTPKYTGSVTSNMPITTPTTSTSYSSGSATAYGAGRPVTAYGSGTTTTYGSTTTYVPVTVHRNDYAAAYFVKQRFSLGVFTRDLNDKERQDIQSNRGTVVQLVVDETPAFYADVLPGDIIQKIDGIDVTNAKHFSSLLNERSGKNISLNIARRGQIIEKSVQLIP